jgi:hypothetical protein
MGSSWLPDIVGNRCKYFQDRATKLNEAAEELEKKISSETTDDPKKLSNLMKKAIVLAKEAKTLKSRNNYFKNSPSSLSASEAKVASVIEKCFSKINLEKKPSYSQAHSNSITSKKLFNWRFQQLSKALHEINSSQPTNFIDTSESNAQAASHEAIPSEMIGLVSRFKNEYKDCYTKIMSQNDASDAIEHYLKLMNLSKNFKNLLTQEIINDPIFGLEENELLKLQSIKKELNKFEGRIKEGSPLKKARVFRGEIDRLETLIKEMEAWTPSRNKSSLACFSSSSKTTVEITHPLLIETKALRTSTKKSFDELIQAHQEKIKSHLESIPSEGSNFSSELTQKEKEEIDCYVEAYELHVEHTNPEETREIKTRLKTLILQARLEKHLTFLHTEINSDTFKELSLFRQREKLESFQKLFSEYQSYGAELNIDPTENSSSFLMHLKILAEKPNQPAMTEKKKDIDLILHTFKTNLSGVKQSIIDAKQRVLTEKLQSLDPTFKKLYVEKLETKTRVLEATQVDLFISHVSEKGRNFIVDIFLEENKKVVKVWESCIDKICHTLAPSDWVLSTDWRGNKTYVEKYVLLIAKWKATKHEGNLTAMLATLINENPELKQRDVNQTLKTAKDIIAKDFSKQLSRNLTFEDVKQLLYFADLYETNHKRFFEKIAEDIVSKYQDIINPNPTHHDLKPVISHVKQLIKNLSPTSEDQSDEYTLTLILNLLENQRSLQKVPLDAANEAVHEFLKPENLTQVQTRILNIIIAEKLLPTDTNEITDDDLKKHRYFDSITGNAINDYQNKIDKDLLAQ